MGILVLPGTAALAKPQSPAPPNDTIAGAIVISSIPFSTTEDTTKATTDSQDAAVNANCGAPHTDASVWFSITASSDASYLVDVSQSNYSAGVIVASGSPGSLNLEACGPGSTVFSATQGTTYYILAFDDQSDGSGNGGQLTMSVDLAPPPPTATLTVSPVGHFDHSGNAIITGTETCTAIDFQFGNINVYVTQSVGRVGTVQGSGYSDIICDGAPHQWSALVFPSSGRFAGGKANVQADAFVCNITTCVDSFVATSVQLRK